MAGPRYESNDEEHLAAGVQCYPSARTKYALPPGATGHRM